MKFQKGINLYKNYEVNESGTIARNIDNGETVYATMGARYATFNFPITGTTINVHTLVGHAWLPDTYEEGLCIDHLDSQHNNHYTVLEWVTRSENMKRMYARRKAAGLSVVQNCGMTYEIFVAVLTLRNEGVSLNGISKTIEEVHSELFNSSTISNICTGKSRKGYWEYLKTDSVNNWLYK